MIEYIKDVVAREVKKSEILKHIPGTVIEIIDNTDSGKAVVKVMGRKLTLINKTGEILKVGDSIIVHYWDNMANGYIALRCGLPNPAGGLNIYNAVVAYESDSTINTISKYTGNVYSENKYKCTYDTAPDIFYLNGCPAFLTKYASLHSSPVPDEYREGIKDELRTIGNFSQQITVIVGRNDISYPVQETFYTHISFSSNIMGRWAHRIGLYSDSDDTYYRSANEDVYFYGIPSGAGIIIVCNEINGLKSGRNNAFNYPYGYADGYLAVRCPNGYAYRNNTETATDLIFFAGLYRFAFVSNDERDYALSLTNKDHVIPSIYEG